CDLLLVVGSRNSSNSNRLRELAEKEGISAYLIDTAEDINPDWLQKINNIGVTAGASAPEQLVQSVVERLQQLGASGPREQQGRRETIVFALPKELRQNQNDTAA
ncbi:MAG: 4-hydroxy-3-methylbut-2-enyl diphosphate reductase, partial [Candidatus Competibacteraceae bacterium]|nr:4-hydroxy-3-methylbut-2-enyl diphosphate reductase [Candidatus Competibacteraceae bacterium]